MTRETPPEWRRHLINIRFKPEAVKNVPAEYLEDHEFLKEAVKVSSFCLYFLPEYVKDTPAVAKLTIETNPDSFGMLAEKFRGDREFVESLDISMINMYPYLSEELRSDRDFVAAHLPQNTAIFIHLPETLRDDEILARTAIFAHEDSASDYLRACSDRLRDKKEFVRDVIEFSPKAYGLASDTVRSDIDIAKLAIGKRAILFPQVPEKLRGEKDLVRIVAAHAPHSMGYAAEALAQDESFILELIEINPEILSAASYIRNNCSANRSIMLTAIAHNKDLFLWADAELQNDSDFIRECAKMGVNEAWKNIGDELADDESFVIDGLQRTGDSRFFMHASARVRGLEEVAIAAIETTDITALGDIHPSLYENPDFISLIVENYSDDLKDRGSEIEHHTLWLKIGCNPGYDFSDIPSLYRNGYDFVRQLVDLRPELGENSDVKAVLERYFPEKPFHNEVFNDLYGSLSSLNAGGVKEVFMEALDQSSFAKFNKKPHNPDDDFAANMQTLYVDKDVIAMVKKGLEDVGKSFQPLKEKKIIDRAEPAEVTSEIEEFDCN